MFNIVIFGAPGSGKGTQSEKLIDEYGLFHISTGEVLRDHISRGTDLGKIADSYISQGQLIPDDLMIDILDRVLDDNPESAKGVIFDGFPRTIPQAEALKKMLEKRGSAVHAVVGLEVDDDELVDRLKVYHSQTSPLREYYVGEGKYHAIPGSGDIDEIFCAIKKSIDGKKAE